MLKRPSNRTRTEIQVLAKRAIETNGGPNLVRVWYKFDCRGCGERCQAPEPNVLPMSARCAVCGTETQILGAGYSMEIRRSRFIDWDSPDSRPLVVRKQYESDKGDA